ncbi:MAG: hypothetical protein ABSF41_16545 [Pseudolabrys sp.]|jgi:hypothetical protein
MKKCSDLNNDVSKAALIRAAREAVAGALAGDFPIDPLIGKELSARALLYRERGEAAWRLDRNGHCRRFARN